MPSVWASVRYQDGMRADLFAEHPVSLLGKSDEKFGMFVRTLDILMNIYKAGQEISPLLWSWDGNFRGKQKSCLWPNSWDFILKALEWEERVKLLTGRLISS